MNQSNSLAAEEHQQRRRLRRRIERRKMFLLSLLLLVALTVGGTLAFLVTQDGPVENTFLPSQVSCSVEEKFDGTVKSNVNVQNTGDTDAYIRVKLVSYRVNEEGQHIGGIAEIPAFDPGINWVEYEGYYYYTQPVKPGAAAASDLIDHIALTGAYSDTDGGKQVIEVMAEAIQGGPAEAIGRSWGVTISEGQVTPFTE